MRRFLFILILYFAIGIQISIAAPIPALGWDIDFVLIFLVIIASLSGRGEAVLWAIFAGFLLDIFDPSAMGGNIASKASAIYLFIILNDSMNLEQPALLGITIFILTFIDRLIFRLFSPFVGKFGWALLRFDLPSAILTAIISLVVLTILIRLGFFIPRASIKEAR